MNGWTENGRAFSHLLVEVFRVNGLLLEAGNEITRPTGLTSARWQVLGVVEHGPLPAAHVGRTMGLTRQNVQQIADALSEEGFLEFRENPHHRRAKLLCITPQGTQALATIGERQVEWANRIGAAVAPDELSAALATLARLRETLERDGGDPTV
jgi:DNA-binding MarR family transcriptional regulator